MNRPDDETEVILETLRMVVEQGRPSFGPDGTCLYRGPDGLRCAVGHWLPDTAVTRTSNGKNVHRLTAYLRKARRMRPSDREEIREVLPWLERFPETLATIQRMHDLRENWETPTRLWHAVERTLYSLDTEAPEGWNLDWVRRHWRGDRGGN